MAIDSSIYYNQGDQVKIKTPSENLAEIASTKSSLAYARATELQSNKAERQLNEETAIEDALMRSTKADGQLDEDQAILNVARISPMKALEMKDEFAKNKAEAAAAEAKFNALSAAERSAHLKDFREKSEFMAEQARGVLALPKEQREIGFQRMRKTVSDATGEDIGNFYNEDRLNQVVKSSKFYDEELKLKETQAHKDRLLEFQADIATTFGPMAEAAAKDRTKQARFTAAVLGKYADLEEARAYAYKGVKGEGGATTVISPGVRETAEQHDIDNVIKASKDFQDDPNTKNMDIITAFSEPVSKQWAEYKAKPSSAKRQFVEQNLIVAFAKIADPTSVVMPGEFKRTVLGQPWLKEIYNKALAGTSLGGIGLNEAQLNVIADYINLAQRESIKRARPGYTLMKERIQEYKPGVVERETKRWKHLFEDSTIKLNPEFENKTDEELRRELEML
jgi:hypothetical protein